MEQSQRKNFMNPPFDDPLKKREEFAVNLRKQKNQELLKKKRQLFIEQSIDINLQNQAYKGYYQTVEQINECLYKMSNYIKDSEEIINIETLDYQIQYLGQNFDNLNQEQIIGILTKIRKIFNLLIDEGFETKQLKLLLQMLNKQLFELLYNNRKYVDINDVYKLDQVDKYDYMIEQFRQSFDSNILEQTIIFIGNLILEEKDYYALIKNKINIYERGYQILVKKDQLTEQVISVLCWLISSNMKIYIFSEQEGRFAIEIANYCVFCQQDDIVQDCLLIYQFISSFRYIELKIGLTEPKIFDYLLQNLLSNTPAIYTISLNIIGKLYNEKDEFLIKNIKDIDILDNLFALSNTTLEKVQKQIFWTLENYVLSDQKNVQKVIQHHIFDKIISSSTHTNINIRNSALYALLNIIYQLDYQILEKIIKNDDYYLIQILVNSLQTQNLQIQNSILINIQKILELDRINHQKQSEESINFVIDEMQGVQILQDLEKSTNEDIAKMAQIIIQTYFNLGNEDDIDMNQNAFSTNGINFNI